MSGLISTAMAADAATNAAAQPGSPILQVLPLLLIFAVFYFMIIRPQSRRKKETLEMIAGVTVGDEVVTVGGMLGKVVEAVDQYCTLEVADNVRIKIQRSAIGSVLLKGTLKTI